MPKEASRVTRRNSTRSMFPATHRRTCGAKGSCCAQASTPVLQLGDDIVRTIV